LRLSIRIRAIRSESSSPTCVNFAAVVAAVDAVAERRVVARILLARADVEDVGFDGASASPIEHVLVVEDRFLVPPLSVANAAVGATT
jgi:hypothetical protein